MSIVQGLEFLHSKGIAHRDLKPANILVGNGHYASLSDNEVGALFQQRPIACKLTDFGESRSFYAQTNTVQMSRTSTVDRGTVVYMSPEILLPEKNVCPASIPDLMLADIWAVGMIFFNLVNPSLKCPYLTEIRAAELPGNIENVKMFVSEQLRNNVKPAMDQKYEAQRATVWRNLEAAYLACTTFANQERPSLEAIKEILHKEQDFHTDCECCYQLKVSQSSALEIKDAEVAANCANGKSAPGFLQVQNDGTNACAFLAIKIADRIINVFDEKIPVDGLKKIAQTVEEVIWFLLTAINNFRQVEEIYDVLSAYAILNHGNLLATPYEFSEELPYADHIFSPVGRERLFSKLKELGGKTKFTALYTCEPYILLVGCLEGKPYVLDTHPISSELGGRGNGVIRVYADNSDDSWMSVCVWIWAKLANGGVKLTAGQSLTVMTPVCQE